MNDRIILHCDVNNFFASVECAINPSIKHLPVAVTGEKSKRNGIVLAKNQVAKSFNIKTGDVIFEAQKKCPDLICVRPHHDTYLLYSNNIRKIYEQYTDKVEPFGIDECWLDITDTVKFFKSPQIVANQLRARMKAEIGVTISVGISFTKTFAKLGSDMKKPDAVTEISKQNFKKIVHPLPLDSIIGIGNKTKAKLEKINIKTLGDLANYDVNILKSKLGIVGVHLHNKANGIDDDEVAKVDDNTQVKSIGNGTTTLVDIKNINEMKSVTMFLCDEIATRLRKKNLIGSTISVDLRRADLSHIAKSKTILKHTATSLDIYKTAMQIITLIYVPSTLIRSIRISVSNLIEEKDLGQINFFENNENKNKLNNAIDKIRNKYGYTAIKPLITDNKKLINSDALRLDDEDFED